MRAYTGVIPDYGAEVEGLRISDVRADGPADKAGIKGGDVVVNVSGKEVKNIYDYTYVLESLKVGEKVKITVLRKGKKVTLEVVPGSRE